jgi:hypothetical protein
MMEQAMQETSVKAGSEERSSFDTACAFHFLTDFSQPFASTSSRKPFLFKSTEILLSDTVDSQEPAAYISLP